MHFRQVVVHTIEEIFFVASIVQHGKFRRIKEASAIQTAQRNEVAPLFSAVG